MADYYEYPTMLADCVPASMVEMAEMLVNDILAWAAEVTRGQNVEIWGDKATLIVETRASRNTRLASNGGDYWFWTLYWIEGSWLCRQERSSCDFWQPRGDQIDVAVMPRHATLLELCGEPFEFSSEDVGKHYGTSTLAKLGIFLGEVGNES